MIVKNVKVPDNAETYELVINRNGTAPKIGRRSETGTEGLNAFYGKITEAYTPKLEWPAAYKIYNEMRRRDPTLRSALNAIMLMAKQSDIKAEPPTDKPADKQAAEILQVAWEGMNITNDDFIEDAFSFLPFGWASFAIGYNRTELGSIGWSGLHYRRQSTLDRWELDDATGDFLGWWQVAAPFFEEVFLPADRLLHFVAQRDGASPEGMALFEPVYEPWHFVKNLQIINGIGWQRTFVGLPVFEYQEGATPSPKSESEVKKIGQGLTVDEKQFVSMPPKVKFRLESTNNSGANALLETIRDYRITMLQVFMAEFLFLGTGDTGSRAAHTDKTDMFIEAVNGWLDKPVEAINKQAVPQLFSFDSNQVPGMTELPRLTHTRIHKPRLDVLGQYIQQIAPYIKLGDEDELWIRSQTGMPETIPEDDAPEPPAPADDNPPEDEGPPDEEEPEMDAEAYTHIISQVLADLKEKDGA